MKPNNVRTPSDAVNEIKSQLTAGTLLSSNGWDVT